MGKNGPERSSHCSPLPWAGSPSTRPGCSQPHPTCCFKTLKCLEQAVCFPRKWGMTAAKLVFLFWKGQQLMKLIQKCVKINYS